MDREDRAAGTRDEQYYRRHDNADDQACTVPPLRRGWIHIRWLWLYVPHLRVGRLIRAALRRITRRRGLAVRLVVTAWRGWIRAWLPWLNIGSVWGIRALWWSLHSWRDRRDRRAAW